MYFGRKRCWVPLSNQRPEIIVEKRTPERPRLLNDRGHLCAVPIRVFLFFLPLLSGYNKLRLGLHVLKI